MASIVFEPRDDGITQIVTCQGNPAFNLTVLLRQPFGDRAVYDASQHPSTERPWPIPRRDPVVTALAAGDPPAAGTANVVSSGGTHGGGLLFTADRWTSRPFEAWGLNPHEPGTIIGFVTPCEGDDCVEECESAASVAAAHEHEPVPDCGDLRRLGSECTHSYEPNNDVDTDITVTFTGNTCAIEVTASPID